MNNFQMAGFNNGNMMQNPNLLDNMKAFKNCNKVDASIFNKMPLINSENKVNLPQNQNNFVNFQLQQMNNNQILQQISQFNINNDMPNMKIDIIPRAEKTISIQEAQMQNQNMMKFFDSGYLPGEQMEGGFNNPNN